MRTLADAHVAVFGVGGVGSYVVEVLARSGVGAIDIFDNDRVDATNINRQLCALNSTVGKYKVEVMADRVRDINPDCAVRARQMFYTSQNADDVDLAQYDYVADCIDTVSAKLELIRRCHELHTPLICAMGAANKLDPTGFRITDISKTKMDPIAKILRKKMRKLGIFHLKVVFSEEQPLKPIGQSERREPSGSLDNAFDSANMPNARPVPASNAFVPAAAGLIIGGEIVKNLLHAAGTMRQA